ncbi:hypothetical protein CVT26_004522 [Gymnopilus dilepis]|uniref:Uncharacterized protein n=1 Tax=Gymnopilus dilepis TaxID=231916 RepID=A0A409WF09_9AGAR|nr:hypothetical protein CVT26_004522 [Gymnopilus dilepis]
MAFGLEVVRVECGTLNQPDEECGRSPFDSPAVSLAAGFIDFRRRQRGMLSAKTSRWWRKNMQESTGLLPYPSLLLALDDHDCNQPRERKRWRRARNDGVADGRICAEAESCDGRSGLRFAGIRSWRRSRAPVYWHEFEDNLGGVKTPRDGFDDMDSQVG